MSVDANKAVVQRFYDDLFNRARLAVATGRLTWADATEQGRLRASGIRTDLSEFLPLRGTG